MDQSSVLYPRTFDPVEHATIHTLPGFVLGDAVVFTSTGSRPGAGIGLALRLIRELAQLDPRWRRPLDENALTLHKSAPGKPYLLLDNQEGPSLSFSHGAGRIWAAMSGMGSVGIDVAYPEEFISGYPLARAFRPEELEYARALCPNDTARGAALIWSAKEASVKATGAGFNLIDPLDVRVENPHFREQGILFAVSANRPISAWARANARGWLSVALA
jgi:phosphopantetheinyl transferase